LTSPNVSGDRVTRDSDLETDRPADRDVTRGAPPLGGDAAVAAADDKPGPVARAPIGDRLRNGLLSRGCPPSAPSRTGRADGARDVTRPAGPARARSRVLDGHGTVAPRSERNRGVLNRLPVPHGHMALRSWRPRPFLRLWLVSPVWSRSQSSFLGGRVYHPHGASSGRRSMSLQRSQTRGGTPAGRQSHSAESGPRFAMTFWASAARSGHREATDASIARIRVASARKPGGTFRSLRSRSTFRTFVPRSSSPPSRSSSR